MPVVLREAFNNCKKSIQKCIFLLVLLVGLSASSTTSYADDIENLVNNDNPVIFVQPSISTDIKSETHSVSKQTGVASWYGYPFNGRRTASGERFNTYAFTAAHKHLPFGTIVCVTNQSNGKSVNVKITDRGPYTNNPIRTLDLSIAAFKAISSLNAGIVNVTYEVIR